MGSEGLANEHNASDTPNSVAAGGAAAATRVSGPVSRVFLWLFSNPLKWFRPTHAGMDIIVRTPFPCLNFADTLRVKFPHSTTLHELSTSVKIAPLASLALVLPATVANFTTGVIMFTAYEMQREQGVSASMAGAVSGLTCSVVTVPIEAVKRAAHRVRLESAAQFAAGTRQIHQPQTFGTNLRAIARETRFAHLRGPLWKVFVAREVVTTSIFFGTHNTVKQSMIARAVEDNPDKVTHLHIIPIVCGALAAGLTTRLALIPFDGFRAHYFAKAEQGAGVSVPLRARFQAPSPLTLMHSIFKTLPSAVGLLAFDFALAREAKAFALRNVD